MVVESELIQTISRLDRDLRKASLTLRQDQARFLVDLYYTMQKDRIRSGNQVRQITRDALVEPNELINFFYDQFTMLEHNVKHALDTYSNSTAVGRWSRAQVGIGPVLAAGLLAHINMEIATNPSKIWRFAGLDPTAVWRKGEKRPWNARLKVICWKMGESFKKFHGHEGCLYGHLYAQEKLRQVTLNDSGAFSKVAEETLATRNFGDNETRAAYLEGKLPPGRLDLRATRKATKIFLVHWWQVAWWDIHHTMPPDPWIIEHGGHTDRIPVPDAPWT